MRLKYLATTLLCLWFGPLRAAGAQASDAQCAFVPFGRPKASDCVYITNHIMKEGKGSIGFVLHENPERPYISMPVFWFYSQSNYSFLSYSRLTYKGTCIIFLMADEVTPFNIDYTWWASMDKIIAPLDAIIRLCMVWGETGFPPQCGGIVRKYGGKQTCLCSVLSSLVLN